MQDRLVLISDDSDFFEFIVPKLSLRKTDELFRFSFDELPQKIHQLKSALLIINSENNQQQTLELIQMLQDTPTIVFGYNKDEEFISKGYKAGMFAFFSILSSDTEIQAGLIPALKQLSLIKQKNLYREILAKNKMITENNEVFLTCNSILDSEFKSIHENSSDAVLAAISPDDKSKFLIQPNQIETIVLNNIRKNDILLNYGTNRYFLLLYNTDVDKAQTLWNKIRTNFSEPIYAGFTYIGQKSREQAVNEVLNRLHESINREQISNMNQGLLNGENFKSYREECKKKLEKTISPIFYQVQQSCSDRLYGVKIEQFSQAGCSEFKIISRYFTGIFKITNPGFTTINIDISYELNDNFQIINNKKNTPSSDAKRITFAPNDFDSSILYDLLMRFIDDFKKYLNNTEENEDDDFE